MRQFSYSAEYKKLMSPELVSLLTAIHEYRGRQVSLTNTKTEVLDQLLELAMIQSTEASNRIEGIVTTKKQLMLLVREKTMPKNRSEKEIAGYRYVLGMIHENYLYIPPKSSVILQLHRDLYKFSGKSIGGTFKAADNAIEETMPDGSKKVRFQPVPAWETPEAMERLCRAFDEALKDPEQDALLLIPMFVLDFLCIHPFSDGNGRMSRLLTLLLLYRAGYSVGKYISLEKLIADSKESYYDALQESSDGWHEAQNDYLPFVRYLLGTVVAAYRDLDSRLRLVTEEPASKPDRVRALIREHLGTITKTEIMKQLPDISQVTVQRALAELQKNNEIIKVGGGRYTSYTWNRENEL